MFKIASLSGTIVYLGIGLLVYVLLYTPIVFTWSDPWLYIIIALWPFALIWNFFVIIFWLALIIILIWAMITLGKKI